MGRATAPPKNARFGSVLLAGALALAGCGSPTTLVEVCVEFWELDEEIDSDTLPGLFDNHIFYQIEDLGNAASRYEGGGNVVTAGEALKELADLDSLSINQIYQTAAPIQANC